MLARSPGAGYEAVEVWIAHCDPRFTDEQRARSLRRILDEHGLEPIGLAGALTEESARVCQWMGTPAANGGLWGTTLTDVRMIVARTDPRDLPSHGRVREHPRRDGRPGGNRLLGMVLLGR